MIVHDSFAESAPECTYSFLFPLSLCPSHMQIHLCEIVLPLSSIAVMKGVGSVLNEMHFPVSRVVWNPTVLHLDSHLRKAHSPSGRDAVYVLCLRSFYAFNLSISANAPSGCRSQMSQGHMCCDVAVPDRTGEASKKFLDAAFGEKDRAGVCYDVRVAIIGITINWLLLDSESVHVSHWILRFWFVKIGARLKIRVTFAISSKLLTRSFCLQLQLILSIQVYPGLGCDQMACASAYLCRLQAMSSQKSFKNL